MIRGRSEGVKDARPRAVTPRRGAVYSRRHGDLAISLPRLQIAHRDALHASAGIPTARASRARAGARAHEEARTWLLGRMKEAGLRRWVDAAGNTFGRLRRRRPGGADGLAHRHGARGRSARRRPRRARRPRVPADDRGVRAAHAAAARRWRRGATRRAATAASSARAPSPASSTPRRSPSMAAVDGERLVDAMARAGYDALEAPKARCDPQDARRLRRAAHRAGAAPRGGDASPSALVEGIVGIRRNRLTFVGEPDHAGTTPMAWRKDAFLAAARVRAQGAGAHRQEGQRPERDQLRAHRAVTRASPTSCPRGPCCSRRCASSTRRSSRGSTASASRSPAPSRGAAGSRWSSSRISRTEPGALRAARDGRRGRRPASALKLKYKRMPSGRRARRAEPRAGHATPACCSSRRRAGAATGRTR